jgi:3-oxoacyl-[acyl-carrier-protein] synthase II
MQTRRVVITGIGIVSPLANTREETWAAVKAGKSGAAKIVRFDASNFATTFAAEVKNFEPTKFIEPKEVKKQDLFSQYTMASGIEAYEDSGLSHFKEQINHNRAGSLIGVGIGGLTTLERYHQAYLEGGPRKISPFLIPAMISNMAPGNLAMRLNLRGVNFSVTSACTSGTHALGEAFRMIAHGIQDIMFAGGSESAVCPTGIGGFCSLKALSTRNDDPEGASRPFDKGRDGFVMGEGAATLVLEEYEHAKQRGANIYCEIIGYGASCDAFHMTSQPEDGEGAVRCMNEALKEAKINPEQVDYINAHGTSTPVNDPTETLAIKTVFGAHAKDKLLVSSTKSMTGHLLGAAGAIEAAFCALSLRDNIIPATINLEEPAEGCDLDYVAKVAREKKSEIMMSNSFGFGGTNGSIILRRV